MIDVIRLLPESIANQIAAGEVVQRPASVVKELLENSVDAAGSKIDLIIREAGKSLIQVVDNGKGMSPTDARMSFERHATSKIRKTEDILKIKTMGFRGEALASIAAVAQVELRTRPEDADIGSTITIHGSKLVKQEPDAVEVGTSISVKNLFYNIPARRGFLKSNPVELKHITDEFFRVSLANASIGFSFYNNENQIYSLEPGKLSKRIVQLFGKNYQNQLIPCQEDTPDIQVTGYIGKPEFAKKTRGEQYLFVNGRFIKNNYFGHAINTAYEGLLPEDTYPFYVLFLSLDPSKVDVNVHPTKTEVKFQDDRLLYGVIHSATRQSLSQFSVTPSLDFEADINFEVTSRQDKGSLEERDYASFRTADSLRKSRENWQQLYEIAQKEDAEEVKKAQQELSDPVAYTIPSRIEADTPQPGNGPSKSLQLHGQYLIRQVKSGMILIDQSAAHERILYEHYLTVVTEGTGSSQSCLFPQHIKLNAADFSLIDGLRSEIRRLGFEFETFGDTTIVINGVPPDLAEANEKDVFEGLLEQFKRNQQTLQLDHRQNLARSLASRMAIKRGKLLMSPEVDELIDRLFACEQPNFTPSGKPTFVILGLDRIGSYFNK